MDIVEEERDEKGEKRKVIVEESYKETEKGKPRKTSEEKAPTDEHSLNK